MPLFLTSRCCGRRPEFGAENSLSLGSSGAEKGQSCSEAQKEEAEEPAQEEHGEEDLRAAQKIQSNKSQAEFLSASPPRSSSHLI